MTGTVINAFSVGGVPLGAGVILADGEYFNCYDPRWINAPAPRNGQFFFNNQGAFTAGQRVTFDAQPGSILSGGTFETPSLAVNVQPA